ncbi:MAG: hypothetical protein HN644_01855 [Rhodospirillales bacterium]|jgi:hypothetical protein|nr:hypothetical protein [Rhodospirillales bacterium]MBT4039644.1 hypothetical protein [Rhodospirillales bacterium]MBT4625261.1 hypothetical protein [Rhodospirillales bacterium]MBT5352534.1 hypothetical protein [Rhodospirillales bacterium]MBT5519514.1 hypothetical protein [Rhodospirillales bacterium]
MALYEVTIYNEVVKERLAEGKRHSRLDDEWADMHYIEIAANDEAGARERIERRHPKHQGFVITEVQALD